MRGKKRNSVRLRVAALVVQCGGRNTKFIDIELMCNKLVTLTIKKFVGTRKR